MFSYVSLEERVPQDHPLRAVRRITDRALERLSPKFGALYVKFGRPSIPPERLLRALLLQALYTIRSERLLVEQLEYNLLFRWFVGLGVDDAVWVPTTFSKNRDRLLEGDVARAFFDAVLEQARGRGLLSNEESALVRRLRERASRSDEESLDPGQDYIRELNEAYQHFFFHYSATPLLVVETSHLDLSGSDEALDDLIRQINGMGRGTQYYVPRT